MFTTQVANGFLFVVDVMQPLYVFLVVAIKSVDGKGLQENNVILVVSYNHMLYSWLALHPYLLTSPI